MHLQPGNASDRTADNSDKQRRRQNTSAQRAEWGSQQISRGWISFSLLKGAQFNRTIIFHANTSLLQLCHSNWRLHFVPEGTFSFGSSYGSSVALQGESGCSLPSPQLALTTRSTTGASLCEQSQAGQEGWRGRWCGDLGRASGGGTPIPPHSIPESCPWFLGTSW